MLAALGLQHNRCSVGAAKYPAALLKQIALTVHLFVPDGSCGITLARQLV
jgi:hypothetical protein